MVADNTITDANAQVHSILNSSFPVLLPYDQSLFLPDTEFQEFVFKTISGPCNPHLQELKEEITHIEHDDTENSGLKRRASESGQPPLKKAAFVEALERHEVYFRTEEELASANKTLTENADLTNLSSMDALVDLFYDLGEDIDSDHLTDRLGDAWDADPLMTLRIIFNARSIHLGKSSRIAAYRAFGWLAENHPITLLANLRWLVRPVIDKKPQNAVKKAESRGDDVQAGLGQDKTVCKTDNEFDMIEASDLSPEDPVIMHDVRFGVSHGYWKDLLNIVVFAANNELRFDGYPQSLLSQKQDKRPDVMRQREWDQSKAKELRHQLRQERYQRVVEKLKNDDFYRALHFTVARLFAQQLKEDKALFESGKKSDLKKISLAAKWAPSFGEFHDKHTFIVSTIAELLYPNPAEICPDCNNRELYLRHAREAFRKNYTSPLRKQLAVVERDIAAERFGDINYERVPSLAMDRYTHLFMQKDFEHFSDYVKQVANGKARISGATLLPSTLVKKALETRNQSNTSARASYAAVKASAEAQVACQVLDGQWKTLCQRIKDSGALNSSIAICDVSGSMFSPRLADGTTPMHSSIGLSLLVSEVTAPPFGGGFITFSANPTYISIGGPEDARGLVEKVRAISQAEWGMNTNLVGVFEDVILPMALRNNLKQEDMVKRVFVFSDMQFDRADDGSNRWASSYERIKEMYADAGYDMPELIFWNLAAQRTDKPVTMEDQNTILVSGYSQGMMKVFLDGEGFDGDEEEVVEEVMEDEDGMMEVTVRGKKDPLMVVKKAVNHKAYAMLEVVD